MGNEAAMSAQVAPGTAVEVPMQEKKGPQWHEKGNPNMVPTGAPMDFFPATSGHIGEHWGNDGKKSFGKGIKRMDKDAAPKLLYNAPLHTTTGQVCFCCENKSVTGRSYIWVMENRLEMNLAVVGGAFCCCGCEECLGPARDNIHVRYWDDIDDLMPNPCACLKCQSALDEQPSVEWVDDSTLCCCMKCMSLRALVANCAPCVCSSGETLYIVPYETMPCPCCCCSNRVSQIGIPCASQMGSCILCCTAVNPICWMAHVFTGGFTACCMVCTAELCSSMEGNCCECCGPTTGAPKMKLQFLPGGLKDEQTAKETACKINQATKEYFGYK